MKGLVRRSLFHDGDERRLAYSGEAAGRGTTAGRWADDGALRHWSQYLGNEMTLAPRGTTQPATQQASRLQLGRVERLLAWGELTTGTAMVAQGIRMWLEVLAPTSNPDFPGRGLALLITLPVVPWGLFGFVLPGGLLSARARWTQFLAVLAVTLLLAWAVLWAIQCGVRSFQVSAP